MGNIREHEIHFHRYADDTQLYISVSPEDIRPVNTPAQCTDYSNVLRSSYELIKKTDCWTISQDKFVVTPLRA